MLLYLTADPRSFSVAVDEGLSMQRSSGVISELSNGSEGTASHSALGSAAPDQASVQAAQLAARLSLQQQSSGTGNAGHAPQPQQEGMSTEHQSCASTHLIEHPVQPAADQVNGSQEQSSRSAASADLASAAQCVDVGATATMATGSQATAADAFQSQAASIHAVRRSESRSRSSSCHNSRTISIDQTEAAHDGLITAANSTQGLVKQRLVQPWNRLLPFLQELNLPILEHSFARLAPVCALQQPTEQDSMVHKLMQCRSARLFDVRHSLLSSLTSWLQGGRMPLSVIPFNVS